MLKMDSIVFSSFPGAQFVLQNKFGKGVEGLMVGKTRKGIVSRVSENFQGGNS